MYSSEAKITTTVPKRYMEQLCKHFEHKLPVTRAANGNSITFSVGVCQLATTDDTLTLHVTAPGADDLEKLEDVVARHLKRFAFREPLEVVWQRHAA